MARIQLTVDTNFKEASKELKQIGALTDSESKRIEKALNRMKGGQIDSLIQRNRRLTSAVHATRGSQEAWIVKQRDLRNTIERLIKNGLDPQDEKLKSLQKEYSNATAQVQKHEEAVKRSQQALEMRNKALKSTETILLGLGVATATFIGLATNEASSVEDITAQFQPLLGSYERAEMLVGKLNETASTTPFQLENIATVANTLLPAMNGNIEDTVSTFRMLGDTAGGNVTRLTAISETYSRAVLKNKVEMGDLTRLVGAGIPIYGELAKTLGVSVQEMAKMVSQGKVTGTAMTATFQRMTAEGGIFFNGMSIASETLSGKVSTLSDNFKLFMAELGTRFLPVMKAGVDRLIKFVQWMTAFVKDGRKFEAFLKVVLPIISGVVGALTAMLVIHKVIIAVNALKVAWVAFSAVFGASGIGTVIVAVGLLIAGIVALAMNWQKVKEFAIIAINAQKLALSKLIDIIVDKVFPIYKKFFELGAKLPGKLGRAFEMASVGIEKFETKVKDLSSSMREESVVAISESKKRIEQYNKEREAKEQLAMPVGAGVVPGGAPAGVPGGASATGSLVAGGGAEIGNAVEIGLKDKLFEIQDAEAIAYQERLDAMNEFYNARLEQANVSAENEAVFLQDQNALIQQMEQFSREEKISAEIAMQERLSEIREEQLKADAVALKARINNAKTYMNSLSGVFSDLQQVAKNSGKESRALAVMQKALSIAQIAINTGMSISASSAIGFPQAIPMVALSVATGAAAIAKVLSTPLPSAETGTMSPITVPNTSGATPDSQMVRVNDGEQLTVTARGEKAPGQMIMVNVYNDSELLYSQVQEGFNSGQIRISQDNIVAS